MSFKILVTGGAGYIGSHACLALLRAGFEVVVVDNLSNSDQEAIERVQFLAHRKVRFYELDICQTADLSEIFRHEKIDAVMHFAGLKAVGESTEKPLKYYHQNIVGTLSLIEAMKDHDVFDLIFSSSATVYGNPAYLPLDEKAPTGIGLTNPYGKTKYFIEEILKDLAHSDPRWRICLLRYFNPIGADLSGQIGEDPLGIPNNLVPYLTKVAIGALPMLSVYGNDYPTVDGTGVRDYIHVVDLVEGHLAALKTHCLDRLETQSETQDGGVFIYNLGTGQGYSVLEILRTFEEVVGRDIPHRIVGRRAGDVASCYADASLAGEKLKWKAQYDLKRMAEDAWRWQSLNPKGYRN
jgi:UDP-glucose 4-epimerase